MSTTECEKPCKNWFSRHLRGKLSLAQSFWVNDVLLVTVFEIVFQAIFFTFLYILVRPLSAWDSWGQSQSYSYFPLIPTIMVELWGIAGVWRSSHAAHFLTRILVLVSAILLILVRFGEISISTNKLFFAATVVNVVSPDPRFDPNVPDFCRHAISKPIIYLYPQKQQQVSVKLFYKGDLTFTYPEYDKSLKGWNVIAYPDGHLINMADKKAYSYLFWEGLPKDSNFDFSTGFIVPGKDSATFLQKTLAAYGLTPKEYNEFIVYWLPRMQNNKFNLIHFAGKEYTDTAPLDISPKPDSLLRVFMVFKPLEQPVNVPPQIIAPFERKGFAVIEWGGTEAE